MSLANGSVVPGAAAESLSVDVRALRRTLNLRRGGSILLVSERTELLPEVALRLAQSVVCATEPLDTGKDPCGVCPACRKAAEKVHPDVLWVEPRGAGSAVRIEDIRFLKERVGLKPYEARRNVGIVLEADRLTVEAANALLKTLEEPPPDAVLMLTAASTTRLLPTVVSRCMVGRIGAAADEKTAAAEELSHWVQMWFDAAGAVDETVLGELLGRSERRALESFVRELVCIYRDAAVVWRVGAAGVTLLSRQPQAQVQAWARILGPAAAGYADELLRLEELIRGNVNVKLTVGALLNILPRRQNAAPY